MNDESAAQIPWSVLVHNDDVNSIEGVVYALHAVCELPFERGLQAAGLIDSNGFLEVLRCAHQHEAETAVSELQLYGLNATVWRP